MNTQPEPLQLADRLEVAEISYTDMVRSAAVLRRLHEANQELLLLLEMSVPALELVRKQFPRSKHDDSVDVLAVIKAAIAKHGGAA